MAEIDEEGNRKTYNYDSNGNLITETDFNNNVTVYTYDGDNRLKKLETDKCITKYTYDNCNNVIAIEKVDNSKENDKVWEHYSAAQTLYERSQTYGFRYVNETKYATAGLLYIVPFTEKVMKNVSDTVKQIIDPEHIKLERTLIYRVGGTENSGNTGNAANAIDGNLNTNFQIQTDQQTGDYVGLLFNQMTPVKKMTVALACSGHENDYIPNGVMEYTTDGSSWTAAGSRFYHRCNSGACRSKRDQRIPLEEQQQRQKSLADHP